VKRSKVLIVDDDAAVVTVVAALVRKEYDVLLPCTCSGPGGVRAARDLDPDAIVLDISMPDISGIAAARQILRQDPRARIIFLTMIGDRAIVSAAMAAGARGYVLKSRASSELLPALEAVLRGDTYLSAPLASPPRRADADDSHPSRS
jgi:DNA-binding NarL/FixJ family response regulator